MARRKDSSDAGSRLTSKTGARASEKSADKRSSTGRKPGKNRGEGMPVAGGKGASTTPEPRPQSVLRWTFRAFAWIDDSLQNIMQEIGWPRGSHTQTMIVLAVGEGITRPSALARYLGVSRQAIHQALTAMTERGVLELVEDPDDGRSKIVQFSPKTAAVTEYVLEALALVEEEIAARVGQATYKAMIRGLSQDWGDPLGGEGGLKTPRIPRRIR